MRYIFETLNSQVFYTLHLFSNMIVDSGDAL